MRRALITACAAMLLVIVPASAAAAAPGDEPSTAIPAALGGAQYDSSAMTESSADPASCGEFEGFTNTMWFSWTAPRTKTTLVDINSFVSDGSTDFLAILFVYSDTNGQLTLVGCSAYPATVTFQAAAGTKYVILSAALGADDTGEPELSDHGGTFDLMIEQISGRILSDRFHASDTFVDDFLTQECGVEVTVTFNDRGMSKTFFTSSGIRMFTFMIVGTTTFSTDDASITFTYAQYNRDPLDGTFTILGMPQKVWVGGKLLILDAGNLVLGPDGIEFVAGPHTQFDTGVDICGLLGA
jgi:hypothetical protein